MEEIYLKDIYDSEDNFSNGVGSIKKAPDIYFNEYSVLYL